MDKYKKEFQGFLKRNNLPEQSIEVFEKYRQLILEWNRRMNLISKNSEGKVWLTHFLDSILPITEIEFADKTLLDLGSGAGFPGIPLKILYPSIGLYLVESTHKKSLFLQNAIKKLDLQGAQVINSPLKFIDDSLARAIDIIVTRAVKLKQDEYEKCFSLLKEDGLMLLYKARDFQNDIDIFRRTGIQASIKVIPKNHGYLGIRNLVAIEKQ
jgi:16S rRNA (guanine527-N7)-methyltransferase